MGLLDTIGCSVQLACARQLDRAHQDLMQGCRGHGMLLHEMRFTQTVQW